MNFETLLDAVNEGLVALISCIDKETQKPVAVICAVNNHEGGDVSFVPLAKLFDGNPYDEVEPPANGVQQ